MRPAYFGFFLFIHSSSSAADEAFEPQSFGLGLYTARAAGGCSAAINQRRSGLPASVSFDGGYKPTTRGDGAAALAQADYERRRDSSISTSGLREATGQQ